LLAQALHKNNTKKIAKPVYVLGFISMLMDMSSEMLYPIMPLYLQHIGFNLAIIGILEGFAELVVSFAKPYFAQKSDSTNKRVPYIKWGYFLGAISKPLFLLSTLSLYIFFVRFLDRLGKGIRGSARDALLNSYATANNKATIFGLHKSMDTVGAVIGPIIAILLLYQFKTDYSTLFLFAFIPGIFSVVLTFFIKENKPALPINKTFTGVGSSYKYLLMANQPYKKLVFGLTLFALINSSDAFIILHLKNIGYSTTTVIGFYIFFNVVFTALAFPFGKLADKLGKQKVFCFGLLCFAASYCGLCLCTNLIPILFCLVAYGSFYAATDGVGKAWIAAISPNNNVATALATFSALQGIATFIASTTAGILALQFGLTFVFLASGIAAFLLVLYFITLQTKHEPT
jgi:MFS family permease